MYHTTEYCPLIGAQYPVRWGQQLNTQFTRPFPPCRSGLARETSLHVLELQTTCVQFINYAPKFGNRALRALSRSLTYRFCAVAMKDADAMVRLTPVSVKVIYLILRRAEKQHGIHRDLRWALSRYETHTA